MYEYLLYNDKTFAAVFPVALKKVSYDKVDFLFGKTSRSIFRYQMYNKSAFLELAFLNIVHLYNKNAFFPFLV